MPEAVNRLADAEPVQVKVLGQFSVSTGVRKSGPWPRPTAKRLCELVLLSPGRTIGRDLACDELFPDLGPGPGARALSKALSMARAALSHLGEPGASLLQADVMNIWASPDVTISTDLEAHEAALKAAIGMGHGQRRDESLVVALSEEGPCLPTSLTPTGRSVPENGWRRSAKKAASLWPETAPVALGARTR